MRSSEGGAEEDTNEEKGRRTVSEKITKKYLGAKRVRKKKQVYGGIESKHISVEFNNVSQVPGSDYFEFETTPPSSWFVRTQTIKVH